MLRKAQSGEMVFIGENPTQRSEPPKERMSERRGYFRRQLRQPEETGDGVVGDNAERMDEDMVEDEEEDKCGSNLHQLDFLAGVSMGHTGTTSAKVASLHEDTSVDTKVAKCSSGLRGVHGVAKRKGF